jgi:hypothetical protein
MPEAIQINTSDIDQAIARAKPIDRNNTYSPPDHRDTESAEHGEIVPDSILAGKDLGAGFEFNPIPLNELGPSEPPPWLWEGYIARGYITLFTGLWKAGKTTLVSHLLRDFEQGGAFIPEPVEQPVLVISEEANGHWLRRRDALGLGRGIHLQTQPFLGSPSQSRWEQFIERVADEIRNKTRYSMVVFDTLPSHWPVRDENDAAQVIRALSPLHQITFAGSAVLLLHHPRKSEGGEGKAPRGSGALSGFVDQLVELHRYDTMREADCRRRVIVRGRFDNCPPETVIELTDDVYKVLGERAEAAATDRRKIIAELIAKEPGGLTADEIHERWPASPKPGLRTLRSCLEDGFSDNAWSRSGNGVKGSPYRYINM